MFHVVHCRIFAFFTIYVKLIQGENNLKMHKFKCFKKKTFICTVCFSSDTDQTGHVLLQETTWTSQMRWRSCTSI